MTFRLSKTSQMNKDKAGGDHRQRGESKTKSMGMGNYVRVLVMKWF